MTPAARVETTGAAHRVVATAGHVDHGKSSLIMRLTGIDPDRWAEEKRRGLTIDLGYAWCALPSGREVGFVDVPGHERFIRNMLAGVGPAPLVLFVVAADEGWKPQSEEHLEILDVLGVSHGVVALTKVDLVDDETLAIAEEEVLERLQGTTLAAAPVVPVSAVTGEGLDPLRTALDAVLERAPAPRSAPARLFVDRVFTIKGAGTVATGTLTGGCLSVGDEIAVEPGDRRARVRSLQTHRQSEDHACPVARVAANLVGTERDDLERGDVITHPAAWLPTSTFDVELRAVRGLTKALSARGAFKVYAGAAEADARVRFLDGNRLEPGDSVFARLRTSHPLVLAVGDHLVLREAGRRETVAGGLVLDVAPGKAAKAPARLTARTAASPDELPALLVTERGALVFDDVPRLVGHAADPATAIGAWAVDPSVREAWERAVTEMLAGVHEREPLAVGAPVGDVRSDRPRRAPLGRSASRRGTGRGGDRRHGDVGRRGAIGDHGAPGRASGHARCRRCRGAAHARRDRRRRRGHTSDDRRAGADRRATRRGRGGRGGRARVRVSKELVFTPDLVARAESIVRRSTEGITVSAFREALHTSRKFALPLLEYFDRTGISRRDGDLRFPR